MVSIRQQGIVRQSIKTLRLVGILILVFGIFQIVAGIFPLIIGLPKVPEALAEAAEAVELSRLAVIVLYFTSGPFAVAAGVIILRETKEMEQLLSRGGRRTA